MQKISYSQVRIGKWVLIFSFPPEIYNEFFKNLKLDNNETPSINTDQQILATKYPDLIEKTTRKKEECHFIVESGMSDGYPFGLWRNLQVTLSNALSTVSKLSTGTQQVMYDYEEYYAYAIQCDKEFLAKFLQATEKHIPIYPVPEDLLHRIDKYLRRKTGSHLVCFEASKDNIQTYSELIKTVGILCGKHSFRKHTEPHILPKRTNYEVKPILDRSLKVSSCQDLPSLFDASGVRTTKQLNSHLSRFSSSEIRSAYLVRSWDKKLSEGPISKLEPFVYSFFNSLMSSLDQQTDDARHSTSLSSTLYLNDISSTSLRCALSAFSDVTAILDGKWIHSGSDWCPESQRDCREESLIFSPDLIKSYFKLRKYVTSGQLRILPSALMMTNSYTSGFDKESNGSLTTATLPIHSSINRKNIVILESDVAGHQDLDKHNGIVLPEFNLPYIDSISLDKLSRMHSDYDLEFERFRKAYAMAIREFRSSASKDAIDNSILLTISQDTILPEVRRIEAKYSRILRQHKSLLAAGALLSLSPVIGAIVDSGLVVEAIQQIRATNLATSAIGMLCNLIINRAHYYFKTDELKDEDFFIIWKMSKGAGLS